MVMLPAVGRINPGEIFGEMGFFTKSPRTATVKATSRCCVRTVNQDDFFEVLKTNHRLSVTIAQALSKRIVELNNRIIKGC